MFNKWSLPTQEPQSLAPGEPGGLSKCPFNKMEGSVSFESNEETLQLAEVKPMWNRKPSGDYKYIYRNLFTVPGKVLLCEIHCVMSIWS